MKGSSFDNVSAFVNKGGNPDALTEDLELVVRRCEEVQSLAEDYGTIELSPYMKSMLGVSRRFPRKRVMADRPVPIAVIG